MKTREGIGGSGPEAGPTTLPMGVRVSVLLRSLLVQAAWNYRTMLGTGMAFALTPVLRHVHSDPDELERAVARHASLFNAHPYLASLALGALGRMEMDGVDPAQVDRFRSALRGPLGAVGDRLVWAGWLPLCSLLGISVSVAFSIGAGVVTFLLVYNAGHLALRLWGFEIGWSAGRTLGSRLRELGLAREARRIEAGICLLVGVVSGALLMDLGRGGGSGLLLLSGVLALLGGHLLGPRAWRPTAWIVTLGVGVLALAGHFLSL